MANSSSGKLLVPVANPETVDRLLNTAVDVAKQRSMDVLAYHVVRVPPQVPLSEGDAVLSEEETRLLDHVEEQLSDAGVEFETQLRFARDVATGIVGGVDAYEGDAILLGWRGRPRRRDIVLGSFLDRVLGEAPCDVYVKRVRLPRDDPESILVPVAGGPHDELATELAGWIAAQHDADVTLLHVHPPDTSGPDVESLLESRHERLPAGVDVEARTIESDHVAGAITDESAHHDLTVLGATRDPFLRRKLVGSVAQGVGRTAGGSVIVTRRHVSEDEDA